MRRIEILRRKLAKADENGGEEKVEEEKKDNKVWLECKKKKEKNRYMHRT